MLIRKGPDINITDRKGKSALLIAADIRNPAAARLLLNSRADFNHTTQDRQTALIYAYRRGATQVAKLLIQAGCGVKLCDLSGEKCPALCQ
jgi:ankyrin repeat protein